MRSLRLPHIQLAHHRDLSRYEGQKHTSQSYFVLLLALLVTAIDLFAGFGRIASYARSIRAGDKFSLKTFWRNVILAQDERPAGSQAEYANLVAEEPEEIEMLKPQATHDAEDDDETAQWANDVRHHHVRNVSIADTERTVFDFHSPRGSQHSDETLHEHTHSLHSLPNASLLRKIGSIAFATLERSLVFAAFGQLLLGIVIYTGGCRENYINGCLAHLISACDFILLINCHCLCPTHNLQRAEFFGVTDWSLSVVSLVPFPSTAGHGTALPSATTFLQRWSSRSLSFYTVSPTLGWNASVHTPGILTPRSRCSTSVLPSCSGLPASSEWASNLVVSAVGSLVLPQLLSSLEVRWARLLLSLRAILLPSTPSPHLSSESLEPL